MSYHNYLIFSIGLSFFICCTNNHKNKSGQTNIQPTKKDTLATDYFYSLDDTLETIKSQSLPQISIHPIDNSAEITVIFKNVSNDTIWIPTAINLQRPEYIADGNCYLEFQNTNSKYTNSDIDCVYRINTGSRWQKLAPSSAQKYNFAWLWLYPNAKNCKLTFRLVYNPISDRIAVSNYLTATL